MIRYVWCTLAKSVSIITKFGITINFPGLVASQYMLEKEVIFC